MAIRLRNQKPAALYADPFALLPSISATKSIDDFTDAIDKHIRSHYVSPIFVPINAAHPVVVEDTSTTPPQTIDEDTLMRSIMVLWGAQTIDVTLENQVNEVYRQGVQYHAINDWYFDEQLSIEALTRMKLPIPMQRGTKVVKYSASVDVIPAAKTFLAAQGATEATNWFANIAAYTHDRPFNNYLLMTVQTADVFEDIKQLVKNCVQLWQTKQPINKDVNALLADFDKLDVKSDLSAGLFLPNGGLGGVIERGALSFTRILMYAMSQYEQDPAHPGALTIQPSNLKQLYLPENLIIINLENYAHAKPSDIKDDWTAIEKALAAKKALNFISNKKLMTTNAVSRSLNGKRSSSASSSNPAQRARVKPFSGKPIPAGKMLAMMAHVIASQVTSQVTQNTYKRQKISYMRPNRRKPDDINLPGKLVTTMYRPDIHVYLDTSGSISESQYRDAVTNLILLTKKIDCNLYVTSFSHYVSQTTLLRTRDKSMSDVYRQFLMIPKVTGGTDFEHVWQKIDMLDEYNRKNNRSHQINFIITDFGYDLTNGKRWDTEQASLKHTYYVPISINKHGWTQMMDWARMFKEQMMKAGDYGVRKRMLI